MRLNPYLTFNGQCREAFQFYKDCLGGEIVTMMTYGDSPMAGQAPVEYILHCTLAVGDQVLAGVDLPPERYRKPQGFTVTLNLDDAAEADRIFTALAGNGTVEMPLQPTFWARRFGTLIDRFGTPWMINCGIPAS